MHVITKYSGHVFVLFQLTTSAHYSKHTRCNVGGGGGSTETTIIVIIKNTLVVYTVIIAHVTLISSKISLL